MWYTSSDGRINLQMTKAQAQSAMHPGDCEHDVRALMQEPKIARQLRKLNPEDVKRELDGYGAWDDDELADHEMNLVRLVWLAAGDILET